MGFLTYLDWNQREEQIRDGVSEAVPEAGPLPTSILQGLLFLFVAC